ncbi:MAG: hypothetical protein D6723_02720 [Acidobacteria bacterium]|nr:MAG: hypothetical protein D6723_02720 [Acidobacteriota bacterium]
MAGAKIEGLDEARRIVRAIGGKIKEPRPALDAIGRLLVDSIVTNFEKQGRPLKWKPLKPATVKRKKRHPDKILIESQTLMDSITHRVSGRRVEHCRPGTRRTMRRAPTVHRPSNCASRVQISSIASITSLNRPV